MNPLWGHGIGVVIVLLMMVFIGTWIWAWLPRHVRTFEKLAQIPMEDPVFQAREASSEGEQR